MIAVRLGLSKVIIGTQLRERYKTVHGYDSVSTEQLLVVYRV